MPPLLLQPHPLNSETAPLGAVSISVVDRVVLKALGAVNCTFALAYSATETPVLLVGWVPQTKDPAPGLEVLGVALGVCTILLVGVADFVSDKVELSDIVALKLVESLGVAENVMVIDEEAELEVVSVNVAVGVPEGVMLIVTEVVGEAEKVPVRVEVPVAELESLTVQVTVTVTVSEPDVEGFIDTLTDGVVLDVGVGLELGVKVALLELVKVTV